MAGAVGLPNQTLFIQNINEKLSRKHRLEELKLTLKSLFKPHGEILDIVALSNFYCKGQAFIVFRTIEQAAQAMGKLQGHEILGKKVKIAFARTKSDVVSKMDGTFRPREKKIRPKPKSGRKQDASAAGDTAMVGAAPAAAGMYAAQPQAAAVAPPTHHHVPQQSAAAAAAAAMPAMPHPILFLEGLPPDISPQNLSDIFRPYAGFKEVRMVPSRPGIAFCEFETADLSTVALHRLQGMPLGQFKMIISYSKA